MKPAGQPDRRHRRLGARVDQPHLLDRRTADDLLGELDLARRSGVPKLVPCGGRGLARPRPPRGGRGRGSAGPTSRPGRRSGGRRRRTASGPSPRTMNRGVPPTARNARTGELTPPGTMARARSNRAWEAGASSGYGPVPARYDGRSQRCPFCQRPALPAADRRSGRPVTAVSARRLPPTGRIGRSR